MDAQYVIPVKVTEEDYRKLCHMLCTNDASNITLFVNEAIVTESPARVVELSVGVDV